MLSNGLIIQIITEQSHIRMLAVGSPLYSTKFKQTVKLILYKMFLFLFLFDVFSYISQIMNSLNILLSLLSYFHLG